MPKPKFKLDPEAAMAAITALRFYLDRLEALVSPALAALPANPANPAVDLLDPLDPRNKSGWNLTDRGIEVCYRLFDQGKSIYEVKVAMNFSYVAAKYRYDAWCKAGGKDRPKGELD